MGNRFKSRKLFVFYDGWCPLCRKSAIRLQKLDWLNLLELTSLRDKEIVDQFSIPENELTKRIQSTIYGKGVRYEGIYTLLQISLRIPILWLTSPFIALSIIFGVGQSLYDWIAKRRTILPTGQCSLHGGECINGEKE